VLDPGHDHYDVTVGKRKQAIALGAQPVDWQRLAEITRAKTRRYRTRRSVDLSGRTCPACVHVGKGLTTVEDIAVLVADLSRRRRVRTKTWGVSARESRCLGAKEQPRREDAGYNEDSSDSGHDSSIADLGPDVTGPAVARPS
jgi:hypothetical protein